MIRKLIAAAALALVVAPLVALHQLEAIDPEASMSLTGDEGGLVLVLEVRGLDLEPLLAALP